MIRFLLRRLVLMVTTLAGVILLTFILFNVVGGSPAQMVLGEKADAAQLQDFEEVRGLNRPLFFGHWMKTRALVDVEEARFSGSWAAFEETPEGRLLPEEESLEVPLAFSLSTNRTYRLELTFRNASEATILFGGKASGTLPSTGGEWAVKQFQFSPSRDPFPLRLQAGSSPLLVREAQLREQNDSFWSSQLAFYLEQILHLDFGVSHFSRQRVSTMLLDGIGPSLMLAIPILIGGLLSSVVLSLICAYWRDRWPDRSLVVFSVALMSVNYLVWIVAGQYLLGYQLEWFPVWGFESWAYLLLPVGIGIVSGLGQDVRLYRTVMLDEMYRDYVRTARAKGCSTPRLLFVHVLRNALIPIITNLSMVLPFLYTGSLLLETYFGIPGLGYLGINGIFNRDIDVVRAVVLIGAVLYMLCNLAADLLYAVCDPRVKIR